MIVGVAEKRHPELVILQPCDAVGYIHETGPSLAQGRVGGVEIGHAIVHHADRGLARPGRPLAEHQAHLATLEKCQPRRGAEQEAETQHVAVERDRALEIRHRDGELADAGRALVAGVQLATPALRYARSTSGLKHANTTRSTVEPGSADSRTALTAAGVAWASG
jgi:hypothetical protein